MPFSHNAIFVKPPTPSLSYAQQHEEELLRKRCHKLERRVHKITLRDMQNQSTIVQLDRLLKDNAEKHRSQKQKLEFKLQQAESTCSELRAQLQFMKMTTQ